MTAGVDQNRMNAEKHVDNCVELGTTNSFAYFKSSTAPKLDPIAGN